MYNAYIHDAYTHVYKVTHIHTQRHEQQHAVTYIHYPRIHTDIHTHTQACTHMHTHAHTVTHIHTQD